MVKTFIKNILKHIPPFKQFWIRINNLEIQLNKRLQELQKEKNRLEKVVDIQNVRISELVKSVHLLEAQNNRISELETELQLLEERNNKKIEEQLIKILEKQNEENANIKNNVAVLEAQNKENVNLKNKAIVLEKHVKRLDARIDTTNYTINYLYYKGLHPDSYEAALNDWYYQRTGKHMDVAHPTTYNEKIQWLKLFDNSPLKTRLTDKYMVRKWISEKIGDKYLIPLLGVWSSFDEIDFDSLPDKFVLKTNHGSGWNLIVTDKATLNFSQAKSKFDYWMNRNYAFYGLELQYMNIPRKIIAEKYLVELEQVYDYKFMCFNGEVKFIWVDTDRFTDHKRTLFTTDWEKMDKKIMYPSAEYDIPKPVNFERMLDIAKALSKGFIHVRVDLYNVNGKIYFGEMTFSSESGTLTTEPKEFESEMGDWIELTERKPYPCYKAIY